MTTSLKEIYSKEIKNMHKHLTTNIVHCIPLKQSIAKITKNELCP